MTDPWLAVVLTVAIPASIVSATILGVWAGRELERNSGQSDAADGPVIDGVPDHVFLARIRSVTGVERHLVILDDGRPVTDATRSLMALYPAADVQQVDRTKLFAFDDTDTDAPGDDVDPPPGNRPRFDADDVIDA